MEISRVFTLLCAFLLIICLALSVTTAIVLRRAVNTADAPQSVREESKEMNTTAGEPSATAPKTEDTEEEGAPDVDADILYHRLCMREVGGRIGIYSEDGILIRMLDVQVKALPKKDREALSKGIYVDSWRELALLIQDYE